MQYNNYSSVFTMFARTNSNVASIKWILKGRLNNALRYMTCHHVSADYTLIGTFMSYKELQYNIGIFVAKVLGADHQ